MPCKSDHMEPTRQESESRRVAKLIIYSMTALGLIIPHWVEKIADHYYGDRSRVHELTRMLCSLCKQLNPEEQERIIYDGHNENARRLATWWEHHQEVDRKREEDEGND